MSNSIKKIPRGREAGWKFFYNVKKREEEGVHRMEKSAGFRLCETCTLNFLIQRLNSVEISTAREVEIFYANRTQVTKFSGMRKSREVEGWGVCPTISTTSALETNSISYSFLSLSLSFVHRRKAGYKSWISGNLVTGVERVKSIKRGEGKNAKKRGKKFWIYCKSFAKFQRYSVIRKRRVNRHTKLDAEK